eukprot:TRINITY_DN25993_c0_g1_i1.p1 TRINITY_DN25993_c0_g1~~TRINITY_DN25993_c0_g1_i1.p1  ORF type:complete len:923 (+),score=122.20 TRINITY_DN25993_c0_g1_i1:29-2770(+)
MHLALGLAVIGVLHASGAEDLLTFQGLCSGSVPATGEGISHQAAALTSSIGVVAGARHCYLTHLLPLHATIKGGSAGHASTVIVLHFSNCSDPVSISTSRSMSVVLGLRRSQDVESNLVPWLCASLFLGGHHSRYGFLGCHEGGSGTDARTELLRRNVSLRRRPQLDLSYIAPKSTGSIATFAKFRESIERTTQIFKHSDVYLLTDDTGHLNALPIHESDFAVLTRFLRGEPHAHLIREDKLPPLYVDLDPSCPHFSICSLELQENPGPVLSAVWRVLLAAIQILMLTLTLKCASHYGSVARDPTQPTGFSRPIFGARSSRDVKETKRIVGDLLIRATNPAALRALLEESESFEKTVNALKDGFAAALPQGFQVEKLHVTEVAEAGHSTLHYEVTFTDDVAYHVLLGSGDAITRQINARIQGVTLDSVIVLTPHLRPVSCPARFFRCLVRGLWVPFVVLAAVFVLIVTTIYDWLVRPVLTFLREWILGPIKQNCVDPLFRNDRGQYCAIPLECCDDVREAVFKAAMHEEVVKDLKDQVKDAKDQVNDVNDQVNEMTQLLNTETIIEIKRTDWQKGVEKVFADHELNEGHDISAKDKTGTRLEVRWDGKPQITLSRDDEHRFPLTIKATKTEGRNACFDMLLHVIFFVVVSLLYEIAVELIWEIICTGDAEFELWELAVKSAKKAFKKISPSTVTGTVAKAAAFSAGTTAVTAFVEEQKHFRTQLHPPSLPEPVKVSSPPPPPIVRTLETQTMSTPTPAPTSTHTKDFVISSVTLSKVTWKCSCTLSWASSFFRCKPEVSLTVGIVGKRPFLWDMKSTSPFAKSRAPFCGTAEYATSFGSSCSVTCEEGQDLRLEVLLCGKCSSTTHGKTIESGIFFSRGLPKQDLAMGSARESPTLQLEIDPGAAPRGELQSS